MAAVVPWSALEAVIEPYYPKAGKRGGQPNPLGAMLRIYFMQTWFGLSDPGMEDALYEIESMRRFADLELIEDALPDEITILNFRHLLETHQLAAQLMNTINDVFAERGLLLKAGTMVDATIILAPSSTKNANSGLAQTVSATQANAPDNSQLPDLLREDDWAVFGDKGHVHNTLKRAARKAGVFWGVALNATKQHPLTPANKRTNRERTSIRSRVEHLFRVMKWQFEYTKVRYRGLVKNAAQVFTLIGLTNLYLARRRMAT